VPRTASVIAQTRTLTLSLSAASLHSILPAFPPLALAIRREAESRLAILEQQQASPFPPAFNLRESIGQVPLFQGLNEEVLHSLVMSVKSRTYAPFTNILVEGAAAPDREIFFIMQGEVEVLTKSTKSTPSQIKARLGQGQYFGELAFLDPFARRTATVRSVTRTTCLVLEGAAMAKVTAKFPRVGSEIQKTAKERRKENEMLLASNTKPTGDMEVEGLVGGVRGVEIAPDVDPFVPTLTNEGFETIEKPPTLRSRRSSLKPPDAPVVESVPSPESTTSREQASLKHQLSSYSLTAADRYRRSSQSPTKRLKRLSFHTGRLSKPILLRVFSFLPFPDLMRLRLISHSWQQILQTSPELVNVLDLSIYNKRVTDSALSSIARFVNGRPKIIDISNCFHVSDIGFLELVKAASPDLRIWKMRSVWDVTGQAISEISQRCSKLEEVDLSNCRKVGDATLSRIVGNLPPPSVDRMLLDSIGIGVKRLTLSYCKHLTDRFMAQLAHNELVASNLEALNIARCTAITDWGFQSWSVTGGRGRFSSLYDLKLADCTFLTDQAIVYLVNAAPSLRILDLVLPSSTSLTF
jgi:F-box and leucine-rich repeat protein 7